MNAVKRFFINIWRFIKCIIEDNIGLYAAQASFFMVISIIPFLMLLIAIVSVVIPLDETQIMNFMSQYIPSKIILWVEMMVNEIFNNSMNISIISLTAVSTLWLSSRGFLALYMGINNAFGVRDVPNYFFRRVMSVFYTICFLVAILFVFVIFGFGGRVYEMLKEQFFPNFKISWFVFYVRVAIGIILLTLIFASLYTFMPRHKIKFIHQIPGAFIASAGWMAFSYAYSIYIEYFSNYSYVYGSLTALIFLMLWMYFCMNIFMYGAEFNKMRINNMLI